MVLSTGNDMRQITFGYAGSHHSRNGLAKGSGFERRERSGRVALVDTLPDKNTYSLDLKIFTRRYGSLPRLRECRL